MDRSAASEDTGGLVSGRPGKSVVYTALSNMAAGLFSMQSKLNQLAQDRDELLARADRDLEDATRASTAHDTPQFEEAVARATAEIGAADKIALSSKQLKEAVQLFDAVSDLALLPLHEIDKDPVREKLDNEFARRVLGLPQPMTEASGSLELLRMKLAREPSIRGHKE
jgi:hypothetical protein